MQEDAGWVHLLIGALTPDQAGCVFLRFFDDRSVSETAEALQRREVAVRSLQHRAIRSLRVMLARGQEPRLPSARMDR